MPVRNIDAHASSPNIRTCTYNSYSFLCSQHYRALHLAPHLDPVVRPIVIALIPLKDVGHVPHDAFVALVVLPGARHPRSRVHDVHFARRVVVPEEHAGQNRDDVLLVVHVSDGCNGGVSVEVVGEGLVAYSGDAEADECNFGGGEVEREVDGMEQGDRRACTRGKRVRR